jgi:starch-binding outer membrane protein, SusD/RagB family
MKNKIFKHIIIPAVLGVMFILVSCTDLKEEVYSDLTAEEFYPKAEDLPTLMGPVYSQLRTVYFGWLGYFDTMEESSDEVATCSRPRGWYDGGIYQRMHEHTWTSLQSHTSSLWDRCYAGVTNANRCIYQIESGSIPIDEALALKAVSELRVARAFYFYILCDAFGNVPITTLYNVEKGYLPEQNTRTEVFDFIVNEINESMPNLSEDVNVETYGRWNKWAAKALLARMYNNAEVYTGVSKRTECINECNDIIASGKYQLETNFKDCFITQNQNSTELIFAIPFDDIYATEFNLHLKTLPSSCQSVWEFKLPPWGYGGSCGIPQFINTYDPDDSRLNDCWIKGYMISTSGDSIRSMVDGVSPLQFKNELNGILNAGEMEGYRLGKYEFAKGCSYLSNDFPVFRYADVLLMKAECLLRSNLPANVDEAAALVTSVRERDFKSNPSAAVVTGAELLGGSSYNYGFVLNGVLTDIEGGGDVLYGRMLDELGWEFCQEARRRQDMIRFNVFTTKKWLSHVPNGGFRSIFPIPDDELNKNPNLVQNSGY